MEIINKTPKAGGGAEGNGRKWLVLSSHSLSPLPSHLRALESSDPPKRDELMVSFNSREMGMLADLVENLLAEKGKALGPDKQTWMSLAERLGSGKRTAEGWDA